MTHARWFSDSGNIRHFGLRGSSIQVDKNSNHAEIFELADRKKANEVLPGCNEKISLPLENRELSTHSRGYKYTFVRSKSPRGDIFPTRKVAASDYVCYTTEVAALENTRI